MSTSSVLPFTRSVGLLGTGLAAGLMSSLIVWTYPAMYTAPGLSPRHRLHLWSKVFDAGKASMFTLIPISTLCLGVSAYLSSPSITFDPGFVARHRRTVLAIGAALTFANLPFTGLVILPKVEKLKEIENEVLARDGDFDRKADLEVETDPLLMEWLALHSVRVIPGTSLLDDHHESPAEAAHDGLKRGTGRRSHIILQPQPSDDPRDPLSWPTWCVPAHFGDLRSQPLTRLRPHRKKEALFWTLAFCSGLVGAMGPLLSAGYVVLSAEWGVSTNVVAATNGDLVLALGCIMILVSPFAVKWGRRPIYILAALDLFLCSIWSAVSNDIESFKWSRGGPIYASETRERTYICEPSRPQIYFVDQRGFRTAIWGFALLAGINITPIVNGYLIPSSLGWKWCFWLMTIFFGIALVLIILFVPETAFDRSTVYDTDDGRSLADVGAVNHATEELEKSTEPKPTIEHVENGSSTNSKYPNYLPAKSIWQELAPYSGYKSKENFLKLVFRPFPFWFSPAVWWAIFSYGLTTAWLVVLSVTSSVVFGSAPYYFDSKQTGLVSIGPLVGTIPTTLIIGPLTDWCATYFARRNGGVFEPEFRLYLIIPMIILEVFGFMGWSLMFVHAALPTDIMLTFRAIHRVTNPNIHWMGPVMMYTIINVRKHTPEAFAVINLTKNLVLYGFTQFAVSVGNSLTLEAIPLSFILVLIFIYGKRIRSFVARHEALYLSVEAI
ncbi:hypothetical protein P7C70_g2209, partial [Phenoliferia sp. Uapishka_3]